MQQSQTLPRDETRASGPNRLATEQSPYLLQHAQNPVDWFPWGEEAFAKARAEDKPVFLSIGYATCHWCHVMAHESFEDPALAARLNEVFVPVKVDREERPAVDDQYMVVCQAMTGGGGWPLTVLLTPDRRPFFAGTYFPKESRGGRTGLRELIAQVERLWTLRRGDVERTAEQLTDALRQISAPKREQGTLGAEALTAGVSALARRYDRTNGGFGGAPKFPSPHQLVFLTRAGARGGDPSPMQMVDHTLRAIRAGGVFDQVGLGVHRYSTDAEWRLPHFEKMLYDQALLALAALEAYEASGQRAHQTLAEELLRFAAAELRDPLGGFHTAQDADSQGQEGRFYVWTQQEIQEALGAEDGALFARAYGVRPEGNFLDEATRERTGANVLYQAEPVEALAESLGESAEAISARLARARQALRARRDQRPHPLQDDKILTDTNGLALAALARGARALGNPHLAELARDLVSFVQAHAIDDEGRLRRRYRNGHAELPGLLDDHAFWIWGLLELYEATFEPALLAEAIRLQAAQDDAFGDPASGAYFLSPADRPDLLVRRQTLQDGAVPSGNSASALNLARLARLTGREALAERAQKLLAAFSDSISRFPEAHAHALCALDFLLGPVAEVVVAGPAGAPKTDALLRVMQAAYLPRAVRVFRDTLNPEPIDTLTGFTAALPPEQGQATAYVCVGRACDRPVTSPEALARRLERLSPVSSR